MTVDRFLLANDPCLVSLRDVHHIKIPRHDVPLVLGGLVVIIVVVANTDINVSEEAV